MEADLKDIAQKHGIVIALKFGSSVTGQEHPRSDVDLAVLLDRSNLTFQEYVELLQSLQPLFADRELDLALINHADPLFLKKITDNCELVYGPPERLQALKIYAFKRYQDHGRFFEMERRFAERFLATTQAGR
jgi:predicted nucleotidyltransferase